MSNNLPNPRTFGSFKAELSKTIKFDKDTKYDLNKIYDSLKSNPIPSGYISKLIDLQILEHNPRAKEILKDFICYSKLDDSIAIVLKDKEEIKAITINRAKNKDGNLIKWKTYGSKKYIQYKIKDDFVFCVYGMAEVLLCELFELSYIAFQSDSIALNLDNHKQWIEEVKQVIQDKYVVLLLDNDDSCRKTINPIRKQMSNPESVISIEMDNLHYMKALLYGGTVTNLPKGYDLRDFFNEIKDPEKIEQILRETIKAELWTLMI